MERKKPPALTSPGKVGFLVALMLVVTGIAVSYFISGTFGVTWHWINATEPSPLQWKVDPVAFAHEMLPLVLVVFLLAFASYVLVAGAVRRYKTYVDSGVEYKTLLRSIKSIEDLEDEEKIDKLKNHPELRDFLMGLKHRLALRERETSEQERRTERPAAQAAPPALAPEAAVLVSAIMNGASALAGDLKITIPELKQIERAVRQKLAEAPRPQPVADTRESEHRETKAALERVNGVAGSVRRDTEACAEAARELEGAVGALQKAFDSASVATAPRADVAGLVRRFDSLAEDLAGLGEETKRIAIASALQASGGADGDSIRVADEVRGIATRFNSASQVWKESGPALRKLLEWAAGAADAAERQRTALAKSVTTLAAKASLWSERMVVLSEQVRGLEMVTDGEPDSPSASVAEPREWGTVDVGQDVDDAPVAAPLADDDAMGTGKATADVDDSFQTQGARPVFADEAPSEDAPFADIPGFEKEKQFFAESAEAPQPAPHASDDHLAVEANDEDGWGYAPRPDDERRETAGSRAGNHGHGEQDDFLTGPRPAVKAPRRNEHKEAPRPAAAAPEPKKKPAARPAVAMDNGAEEDVAEDAMDLYALGAVDYDARVHA